MAGAKGNDGCNNVTSTAAMRRRPPAAVARAARPGRHGRRAATPPARPDGPHERADQCGRLDLVELVGKDGVQPVGDLGSCVSLFGDGSSPAMTGAFTLADA
jgi:hypothetical protein